jgi:hypothetical protein
MDIKINLDSLKDLENSNFKIDAIKFQKMLLLYNSIEQGWSVKKQNETYVFAKKHEGKKEVLEDAYLLKFMKTNLDFNKIVS